MERTGLMYMEGAGLPIISTSTVHVSFCPQTVLQHHGPLHPVPAALHPAAARPHQDLQEARLTPLLGADQVCSLMKIFVSTCQHVDLNYLESFSFNP